MFMVVVDRRIDFCREILGSVNAPSASDRSMAATLMTVVFHAVKKAIEFGLPKTSMAICADSDLGEGVLLRARSMSLFTAVTTDEKDDQFKPAFNPVRIWDMATKFDTNFVVVRINYNPESPKHVREKQQNAMLKLNRKCIDGQRSMMVELTAHPSSKQVERLGGFQDAQAMVLIETVKQLQDAGIDPDYWVVEPPNNQIAASAITAQAYLDGREKTSVLFATGSDPDPSDDLNYPSGDEEKVAILAARMSGVSGLVMGPKIYFSQLAQLYQNIITREEAIDSIAKRMHSLYRIYLKAQITSDIS